MSLKLGESNLENEPDQPSRNLQQARRAKSKRGFDIHAAVGVTASDREGRERLLRYCARAPLSLERLAVLPDGRIAYLAINKWTWLGKHESVRRRRAIEEALLVSKNSSSAQRSLAEHGK